MKKPISAKIDEDVLQYCKANGGKLNTLINDLLRGWMQKNQEKQLIAFQVETGTDELSKIGTNLKCSQSCRNCESRQDNWCRLNRFDIKYIQTFCCIYWKKKKGSK